MKPISHENNAEGRTEQLSGAVRFESPERLISLAQRHYASDFPNPKRVNCPGDDVLRATVFSGELPDEELLAHLFECSDCYRPFQNELAAYRATRLEPRASLWNRIVGFFMLLHAPAFAGALVLLLLMLGGVLLMRRLVEKQPVTTTPNEDPRVARTDKPPDTPQTVTPSPVPSLAPPSPEPPVVNGGSKNTRGRNANSPRPFPRPPRTEGELIAAARPVQLDLEEYVITRGTGEAEGVQSIIKFPRARMRLLLTLPAGSAQGLYSVSIVDDSGRALSKAQKARSADGETLTTILDTSRLNAQKYRLRVSHEGAAPEFYSVVIEDERVVPH